MAVPLYTFLLIYFYAFLIAQQPQLGRLQFSPSRTIFVVGFLSQLVALLLTQLLRNAYNALRWLLASRETGVRITTFLALSGATTLPGVLGLTRVGGPHLIWCAQRY